MDIAYGLVIVHDAHPLLYYELTNQVPYSTSPYHCLRISFRNSRLGETIENIAREKKKKMTRLCLPTLCAETTYQ